MNWRKIQRNEWAEKMICQKWRPPENPIVTPLPGARSGAVVAYRRRLVAREHGVPGSGCGHGVIESECVCMLYALYRWVKYVHARQPSRPLGRLTNRTKVAAFCWYRSVSGQYKAPNILYEVLLIGFFPRPLKILVLRWLLLRERTHRWEPQPLSIKPAFTKCSIDSPYYRIPTSLHIYSSVVTCVVVSL